MSASTKVDPQMVLDLLNAADCDEWKDPSVREMFRLVALGFRQVLAERDELNEDVRSFERELTTIARRPDRRQGESRVCFWLRRIGEQLAEEADRTEKMKAERDAALAHLKVARELLVTHAEDLEAEGCPDDAKHVFDTIEKWGTAHEAVATGIRDVIAEAFPKPEACPRCAVKPDGVHSICSAHRPKAAKVMCNECGEVEKMIDDPRCMVCAFVTDPVNNAKQT